MTEARRARCWDCNYELTGLSAECARCPECGRAFDWSDPRSVNRRRRLGRIARWVLRPVGSFWLVTALVATVAIFVVSWPWWAASGWGAWSFTDVPYFV